MIRRSVAARRWIDLLPFLGVVIVFDRRFLCQLNSERARAATKERRNGGTERGFCARVASAVALSAAAAADADP